MASKRFIQFLLAAAAITAISIGLGVGISKRNAALSLASTATLATKTTAHFSDDCVDYDAVNDHAADATDFVPRRRLGRRIMRATATRDAEWPWEAEVTRELAFSMEYSMSVSGKSGKSSKSSVAKSGKGLRCQAKSGKSHSGKSHKGADYDWAYATATNAPSIGSPPTGANAPSYKPTVFVTVSPTASSYGPTTPAPATSVFPLENETPSPTHVETASPIEVPVARPTPMPIAAFSPPVVQEGTSFPTSGSTPTVSAEVTGPPTVPNRDSELV
ncbi:hypothetical protein ACHAWO_005247 [Cyclotella atomus]|uniref:Uncharacterized protein n=1 Tax=Cyclotella atomus TaxID=382360 RepID=A0ABD3P4B4_9STRA